MSELPDYWGCYYVRIVHSRRTLTYLRSQSLSLTASLKAAQVTSNLELLQSTCGTITTRLLVQQALRQFYDGNNTEANWEVAATDVEAGFDSLGYITLLQAIIYPREDTGNIRGLLNVTRSDVGAITLPYVNSSGDVSYSHCRHFHVYKHLTKFAECNVRR
jgi:osomolarity two-component system, sensor histidine kinase SLN1